jgi:hypothetical protein
MFEMFELFEMFENSSVETLHATSLQFHRFYNISFLRFSVSLSLFYNILLNPRVEVKNGRYFPGLPYSQPIFCLPGVPQIPCR